MHVFISKANLFHWMNDVQEIYLLVVVIHAVIFICVFDLHIGASSFYTRLFWLSSSSEFYHVFTVPAFTAVRRLTELNKRIQNNSFQTCLKRLLLLIVSKNGSRLHNTYITITTSSPSSSSSSFLRVIFIYLLFKHQVENALHQFGSCCHWTLHFVSFSFGCI